MTSREKLGDFLPNLVGVKISDRTLKFEVLAAARAFFISEAQKQSRDPNALFGEAATSTIRSELIMPFLGITAAEEQRQAHTTQLFTHPEDLRVFSDLGMLEQVCGVLRAHLFGGYNLSSFLPQSGVASAVMHVTETDSGSCDMSALDAVYYPGPMLNPTAIELWGQGLNNDGSGATLVLGAFSDAGRSEQAWGPPDQWPYSQRSWDYANPPRPLLPSPAGRATVYEHQRQEPPPLHGHHASTCRPLLHPPADRPSHHDRYPAQLQLPGPQPTSGVYLSPQQADVSLKEMHDSLRAEMTAQRDLLTRLVSGVSLKDQQTQDHLTALASVVAQSRANEQLHGAGNLDKRPTDNVPPSLVAPAAPSHLQACAGASGTQPSAQSDTRHVRFTNPSQRDRQPTPDGKPSPFPSPRRRPLKYDSNGQPLYRLMDKAPVRYADMDEPTRLSLQADSVFNEADWDRVGNKPCIRCNSESNPADHLGNRCYIFFRGTEQGKTWAAQVAESRKSASLLALPGTTVSTGTLLMMTAQLVRSPSAGFLHFGAK